MSFRFLACLVLIGWAASPAGAADWLAFWERPLATAQAVRGLPEDRAAAGQPVHLRGVVTHVNPQRNDFWVQDRTAGVHVRPTPLAAGLEQGDVVEVVGVTHPGGYAPGVTATAVRKVGRGANPDAVAFGLSIQESRWLDSQWVQAWVRVRGASCGNGVTRIDVYNDQGRAVLVIPGEAWAEAAGHLRDANLVVRGVCVPTFRNRLVSGPPSIYLARLPDRPASPEPHAAGAPRRIISSLLEFVPEPHAGGRHVKVAGVVTAVPLPGVLVVQDHTAGATVWTEGNPPDARVGVRVEVSGLLRIDGPRIGLERSEVRVLAPAPLPEPVTSHPGELSVGARDAVRIRLRAVLEDVRHISPNWTALRLSEGVHRFEAFVPVTPQENGLVGLEPGSLVELTGVSVEARPDGTPGIGPGLFLGGPDAVVVVTPPGRPASITPSWWTAARVGYLCGGFLLAATAAGGWVWALRVRVRRAAGEIRRQFEEKASLEKQLRQASKLEAVGRLAGGIAHDFNNLLTVINGCAELLGDATARGGPPSSELAGDILRAGERAAALTAQLLAFSRKQEVVVSAVDLNEVVADTASLLDRVIREDIRIETRLAAGLPPIHAEPGLLHQVIMNLAVNARDAMPHGGAITLSTCVVPEADPVAAGERPRLEGRGRVRLSIRDTGQGMSEEVKARLFEPFFTTKELGKGTGLGLATVYGVVQTLRATIRVESAVGQGTTFQIDFRPYGTATSDNGVVPLAPLAALRPAAARLAGTTILVVEDNEMVRELLLTGLSADGATVLAAARPEHALRLLASHVGPLDVVITDVVMPGMNGRQLADAVRAERPDVRVVFMSGYTADEVLRQGVREDQVEFVQKPFTPDQLTARLLRILGRPPR